MLISATELKENLGYYLTMANTQPIFITKNGKTIAALSSPANARLSLLGSMRGILKDENLDLDSIRMESLAKQL